MKKTIYTDPKLVVIHFNASDILTASTDAFDGEWVPIGGNGKEEE